MHIFEALSNGCSKKLGNPSSEQKQYHRQGLQIEHAKHMNSAWMTYRRNMNDQ